MKLLNLFFAVVSLLLGLGIVGVVITERGFELSLGLVFGMLLMMNAGLRFWAARTR